MRVKNKLITGLFVLLILCCALAAIVGIPFSKNSTASADVQNAKLTEVSTAQGFVSPDRNLPMDLAFMLEFDAPAFDTFPNSGVWLGHSDTTVANSILINGIPLIVNGEWEDTYTEINRCWGNKERYSMFTYDDTKVFYFVGINTTDKIYKASNPTDATTFKDYFNLKFDGKDRITIKSTLPMSKDGSYVLDKDYNFQIKVAADNKISLEPYEVPTQATLSNLIFVENYKALDHQAFGTDGQKYDFAFIMQFDALNYDVGVSGAWLAQVGGEAIRNSILINGVPVKEMLDLPDPTNNNPGDNFIEIQRNRGDYITNPDRFKGCEFIGMDGNPCEIDNRAVWYLFAFNTTNMISTNDAKLDFAGQTHTQRYNLRFDGTDMLTIKSTLPMSKDGSVNLAKDYHFSISRDGGTGGTLSFGEYKQQASLSKVYTVSNYAAVDNHLYSGIVYDFGFAIEFDAPNFDEGVTGAWLAQVGGVDVTNNILINGVSVKTDLNLYNYVTGDLGDNFVEIQRSRNDMLPRLANATFTEANGTVGSLNAGKVWFFVAFDTTKPISTYAPKLDFEGQTHGDRYNLKYDGTDTITIKAGLPISKDGSYVIDRDYTFNVLPYSANGASRSIVEITDKDTVVGYKGMPDLSSAMEITAGDSNGLPSSIKLIYADGDEADLSVNYEWSEAPASGGIGVTNAITYPDLSNYKLQPGFTLPTVATYNIYPAANEGANLKSSAMSLSTDGKLVTIKLVFDNEVTYLEEIDAGNEALVSDKVKYLSLNGKTLEEIAAILKANNDNNYAQSQPGQIMYDVALRGFSVEWGAEQIEDTKYRTLTIVLPSQMYALTGAGILGDGTDQIVIPAGDEFTLPEGKYFESDVNVRFDAIEDQAGKIDGFFAADQLIATGGSWDASIDKVIFFFRTDLPAIERGGGLRNEYFRDNILINGRSVSEISDNSFIVTDFCIAEWLEASYLSGTNVEGLEDKLYFYVSINTATWIYDANNEAVPLLRFDGTDSITVLKDFPGVMSFGLDKNYVWQINGLEDGEGDLKTWSGMTALGGDNYVADIITYPGATTIPDVRYGEGETVTGEIVVLTVLGETVNGTFTGKATTPTTVGISALEITSYDLGEIDFFADYEMGELYVSVVDYVTGFSEITVPTEGKVNEELTLPTMITATFRSGDTVELDIDWDWNKATSAGTKTLTGTIDAEGYLLDDGLSTELTYTVTIEAEENTDNPPVDNSPVDGDKNSGCGGTFVATGIIPMAVVIVLAACALVYTRRKN